MIPLLLLLHSAAGDRPPSVNTTNIMSAGSKSSSGTSSLRGYNAFMCPGFVPVRGHLLAFAEGRIWTCADFGAHDLVMRRSVDDGASVGSETTFTLRLSLAIPPVACVPDPKDAFYGRLSAPGKTWEPLQTILDPNTLPGCNKTEACLPYTEACQWSSVKTGKVCGGGCAVWDPTPVVDTITGEVCAHSNTCCSLAIHLTAIWVTELLAGAGARPV